MFDQTMASRDPYTVLGVARTADADAIKKAFRAKARSAHPDSNPNDPGAEDRFKEINKAYGILGDAEKRGKFDRGEIDADGNEVRMGFAPGGRTRAWSRDGAQGFGFEDIFGSDDVISEIFRGRTGGGRRSTRMRGADISYTLTVDFIDAVRGATKRLGLTNGKTLDVHIPPGSETGRVLRLKGQGTPGIGGGAAGDALIEITVADHPLFRRQGRDILLDLPVTLKEAVLGAKVTVPTVDGKVVVNIPKGSTSGKVLRLRGRGIPGNDGGGRGDELVTLMVALPAHDPALAAFAAAWTPADDGNPRRGPDFS